jgi:hypothetical protein
MMTHGLTNFKDQYSFEKQPNCHEVWNVDDDDDDPYTPQ